MIREFKEFALKGNLVELAVAFVLGVAFAAVVTSLVDDVIMQLVAAIVGAASRRPPSPAPRPDGRACTSCSSHQRLVGWPETRRPARS
jgi:large conductance mechanosensitive channel